MTITKKQRKIIIPIAAVLIAAIVFAACLPMILRRSEINRQFELAQIYLNELDYESAILAFSKVLEIDVTYEEARQALQDAYINYIHTELGNSNFDRAKELIAEMREALDLSEDFFTVSVTEEPNCGADGLELWTSVADGVQYEHILAATNAHTWDSGTIDKVATIMTEGVQTLTCTVCQTTQMQSVPKLTENDELIINDPNLEAVLREAINKPTGMLIIKDFANLYSLSIDFVNHHNYSIGEVVITDISPLVNLNHIKELYLRKTGISDITPLAYMTNLTVLHLSENNVSDISPLATLSNLTELQLWETNITDISPLKNLTGLKKLSLDGITIRDLSLIADLSNLEELQCWRSKIIDLSPLAKMTNLRWLSLNCSEIPTDLSPLANLTKLNELWLSTTSPGIRDLSPLANLTNLTTLLLGSNNITDISPLANLTNLKHLSLGNNKITDLSPLAKLTKLEDVDAYRNEITDISTLANLTNVTELNLEFNKITDITSLAKLTKLTRLNLEYNQIADISALAKMTEMTNLSLGGNRISDLTPLAKMTKLTELYLYSNEISDLSPLAKLSKLSLLNCEYNSSITNWSPVAHVADVRGRP